MTGLKMRVIYPYGLNDKTSGKNTINNDSDKTVIGKLYPPLPRTGVRPSIGRKNKNQRNPRMTSDEFFPEVNKIIETDIKNAMNSIRILLNNSKKRLLKEVAYRIMTGEFHLQQENRIQYYSYIGDHIDTQLWKNPIAADKPKHKVNPCVIKFSNKGFNKLGLSKIFKMEDVLSLLPEKMKKEEFIPYPTFKLDLPIRNKILNYKEVVKSLHIEIDDDVAFTNMTECDCANSPFQDPFHKHVVTGDLRIIENLKLRKLLAKGPSFREPKSVNYNICKNSLTTALTLSIDKFIQKHALGDSDLDAWKDKILYLVTNKINTLKNSFIPKKSLCVLKDAEVEAYLTSIHSKFVLTPIDKASKNVSIICKKFYVNCLLDELGIPGQQSTTYGISERSRDSILEENNNLCLKLLGKALKEKQMDLPMIYWMPKMHYSPSRRRFIIASSNCSTKPLSALASKVFNHIFKQLKSFHAKSFFYSNYNFFWAIENSSPFIAKLNAINESKGAKSISTYDFSTLYTTLPHLDLLRVLNELVDFAFDGKKLKENRRKRYLAIIGDNSYWTNKKSSNSYTKETIKQLITHLIRGCYFQLGNHIFLQKIGIPMGIDPAPFWANLYLYYYEQKFVNEKSKADPHLARKFKFASRFIDDEANLNDNGEFGKNWREIYPNALDVKCEHQGTSATFLELDVCIEEGQYVYKLFDKRDNFHFEIVRMPNLTGNIPDHIFYGSFMAEIIRIARATLRYADFIPRVKNIFYRMTNQGGSSKKLKQHIRKIKIGHPSVFTKFNKSEQEIINDVSVR